MQFDQLAVWVTANPALALVAAVLALGGIARMASLTFYTWYGFVLVVAALVAQLNGGPLYFYAFLLGMITAFAEIIGKFRDEPLKSLKTPQAVFYHLLNGLIAVFALKIYFLNFGEGTTEVDQLKAVLTAGFGSMLLMRSKFFNLKVGDQDISFGPEQIIKVFLSFMERAIDRVRAQSRIDFVRAKLTNIDFAAVDPYSDTMLNAAQTLGGEERKKLEDEIKDLRESTIDKQLKSYRLGFLLLDRMGEDFVSKLFDKPSAEWLIKAPVPVVEKKTEGLLAGLGWPGSKEEKNFYLAYGSSMSTRRFSQRLGWSEQEIARFFESTMPQRCKIYGFVIAFNRLDQETMTGQANLITGQAPPCEGVLYQLTHEQLEFLDRSEAGYRRQPVSVGTVDGKTVQAQAYVALDTQADLSPSKQYLQTVLDGAKEHHLSPEYIAYLEQIPIATDARTVVSDLERRIEEKTGRVPESASP